MNLDGKVPTGELSEKWTQYRGTMNLVAPNNKRRLEVIVVGSGLAGASAAATLGELGYKVNHTLNWLTKALPLSFLSHFWP